MSRLSVRERVVDALIAAGFVAAGQLGLRLGDGGFAGDAPATVTAVAVAAIAVPLAWRRRYPLGALTAVGLAVVLPRAFASIALPMWGGLGSLVFALYSASRWAPRPKDTLALVVPALVLVALGLEIRHFSAPGDYAFSVPVFVVGWLAGQGMRRRHQLSQLLRGHLDDMEQTEALRHAAAVADERARIARELHDVVAHAMSSMVVQAGSARLRWPPTRAASAGARSMRSDRPAGAGRDAAAARPARAPTSPDAADAPQPGLDDSAAGRGARRRPALELHRGRPRRRRPARGPVRLSDRAGGADQRRSACRPGRRARVRPVDRRDALSSWRSPTTARGARPARSGRATG